MLDPRPLPAAIALIAALVSTGCDGPQEEAGEKADVAADLSGTTGSLSARPNERLGERLDQIDAASREKADPKASNAAAEVR